MLCFLNTSPSVSVKSPPTTPTILTSVKKLAEIEKCDAEPPSIWSHLPKGVSTASNATEPTTKSDMVLLVFGLWFLVLELCASCFVLYLKLSGFGFLLGRTAKH